MKRKYKKTRQKKHQNAIKQEGEWLHLAHVWKHKAMKGDEAAGATMEFAIMQAYKWHLVVKNTKKH